MSRGNLLIKSELIYSTCSICQLAGIELAEEDEREKAVSMFKAFGPPNVSQVCLLIKVVVASKI